MDIPGKLREDLRYIYGAKDPLNYVEDIRVETNPDTQEENLVMNLRVPHGCEKYMEAPVFYDIPNIVDAMYYAMNNLPHSVWGFDPCGQPKPPALKSAVATKTFVKPERVFFNGNNTVLVWPDGEKTVVGLGPDAVYDEYAGFCAAIVKKLFGSSREAKKFLDKVKVVQNTKVNKPRAGDAL